MYLVAIRRNQATFSNTIRQLANIIWCYFWVLDTISPTEHPMAI